MNEAKIFFNRFCQNDWSLGNDGLSKIRSLQCYEVLWIHDIDAICNSYAFQALYICNVFLAQAFLCSDGIFMRVNQINRILLLIYVFLMIPWF